MRGECAVVVHDEVKLHLAGKPFIQAVEKLDQLLVAMACLALAGGFDLCDLLSCRRRGGAVALLIVGLSHTPALFGRKSRMAGMQCLDLTLFAHVEHPGVFRRTEMATQGAGELLYHSITNSPLLLM